MALFFPTPNPNINPNPSSKANLLLGALLPRPQHRGLNKVRVRVGDRVRIGDRVRDRVGVRV